MRIRKSKKDRQNNDQRKKDNNLQNITQKTNPTKTQSWTQLLRISVDTIFQSLSLFPW
jgi:hypothetical protein